MSSGQDRQSIRSTLHFTELRNRRHRTLALHRLRRRQRREPQRLLIVERPPQPLRPLHSVAAHERIARSRRVDYFHRLGRQCA